MTQPQDPYGDPARDPYAAPQQPAGWSNPPYPDGPAPGGPVAKPRRPAVVLVAVILWVLTGLFLLLVGLAAALAGNLPGAARQIEDALAGSGLQVDPAAAQQVVVVIGVVFAVLGALLVLLAFLMLRRSKFARVLLTVLGVVAALLLLVGTLGVGTLVVLIAIVLQFLPAANRWFRFRRGAPA